MRLKRSATVAGAMLLVGGLGGVAFAAQAGGSITPNTVPVAAGNHPVTLNWTAGPGEVVFINLCWKNPAPGQPFSPNSDCSPVNAINPQTGTNGQGTTTFQVFSGVDQNTEGWACGVDSLGGSPAGVDVYNPCFIRIAPNVKSNTDEDFFIPVSYSNEPEPVIPEVPLNVLLPASAAALMGAGLLIARKRQAQAA
jgi:hypothetical protein